MLNGLFLALTLHHFFFCLLLSAFKHLLGDLLRVVYQRKKMFRLQAITFCGKIFVWKQGLLVNDVRWDDVHCDHEMFLLVIHPISLC